MRCARPWRRRCCAILTGRDIYVESAGVEAGALDPLAVEAMAEIGIAMASTRPRRFEDLEDGCFDLVVALSPEAEHKALELAPHGSHPGGILADHGPHGGGGLAASSGGPPIVPSGTADAAPKSRRDLAENP